MRVQWDNLTDFAKSIFRKLGLIGISEYNALQTSYFARGEQLRVLHEFNLAIREELRNSYKSMVPKSVDVHLSGWSDIVQNDFIRVQVHPNSYSMVFHKWNFESMNPEHFDWVMKDQIDDAFHKIGRSYLAQLKKIVLTEIAKDHK